MKNGNIEGLEILIKKKKKKVKKTRRNMVTKVYMNY